MSDIQFFREQKLTPVIAIDEDGTMNKNAGFLKGLKVREARDKVVEKLKTENKPEEYFVGGTRTPDVWVSPKVVLEVLADEIT